MPFPPLVEPVDALSDSEHHRTARHAVLAGFGERAQRRLAASRVAVIGAGGLGSPTVLALAAAGVGELIVVDDDVVEVSNLQRQVLHRVSDAGHPKVDGAIRAAADLSPETVVHPVRERLTAGNAARLLAEAHVVIDGSDTFETRAAVAAACEQLGVPLVWGTVQEFDAQVTVFWSAPPAGVEPVVLSDLHPPSGVGEVPSCAQVGVLGALCIQVGGMMAIEAIKLLTGIGDPLLGRILLIDALRARQREVPLRPARATAPPTPAPAPAPAHERALVASSTLPDVAATAQSRGGNITVLDVREPAETATGVIDGALLVPLGEVLADAAALGPGPFLVVCQAGIRAERAAQALRSAGATASVLPGGMNALAAWAATA
ncbi:MAG: ThiF family adenylyltransferase [Microbacterium sp.]|uniref:ThiF family adenylyltransferase n=1 Tax=Microbacterium sp. TaxID=51671 RepID=UPI00260323C8|nr:ThiF family adenylyltransferase [Microbacterium sp.]MCX6502783.1 ThiF family adenylyltransferase [Microbacterium sp.]